MVLGGFIAGERRQHARRSIIPPWARIPDGAIVERGAPR